MSDMAETSPATAIGQRLMPACLFGTVLIAMAGWLWGIGYMVVAIVNWLLA